LLPILRGSILQLIPATIEKQKVLAENQQQLEVQRLDLREREIVALEQIGKTLLLLETGQRHAEEMSQGLASGLSTANQALTILLERNRHFRQEDGLSGSTLPLSPLVRTLKREMKNKGEKT